MYWLKGLSRLNLAHHLVHPFPRNALAGSDFQIRSDSSQAQNDEGQQAHDGERYSKSAAWLLMVVHPQILTGGVVY
jgi:hypothetical protein